ncbi:hypothetical protein [Cohnella nanjingensis]|uniref:Uncharacterized protein n=1 Tax=Cohnella nanjingensis TaxID=1387779 RepID=A0A7X0RYU4_9BACL|nr:hypothetical protein [Cohnella nanjingensis]MBB6674835.1 hypothetical protein [Cohnella nanjingensis]
MEEWLRQVVDKLNDIGREIRDFKSETHAKLDRIESKMDAVYEQVASNTEFQSQYNEISTTIEEHTTDLRILKKLVAK